jgi:hypothetical protein
MAETIDPFHPANWTLAPGVCVGVGSGADRRAKYLLYIVTFRVTPSPIHR